MVPGQPDPSGDSIGVGATNQSAWFSPTGFNFLPTICRLNLSFEADC